jgi:hypothetical protein
MLLSVGHSFIQRHECLNYDSFGASRREEKERDEKLSKRKRIIIVDLRSLEAIHEGKEEGSWNHGFCITLHVISTSIKMTITTMKMILTITGDVILQLRLQMKRVLEKR